MSATDLDPDESPVPGSGPGDAGDDAPPGGERRLIDAARREAQARPAASTEGEERPAEGHPSEGANESAASGGEPVLPEPLRAAYDVIREIERGGQGIVYLAHHRATRRKVAIKVIRAGAFAGAGDRLRFEREAAILGQLRHPGIVSIHDSGATDAGRWIVMDFVAGQPLDRHLMPDGRPSRSPRAVASLFAEIAEAVNAAHLRGIVHRDLKPGNILVDGDGAPRVLDFGLAKPVGGSDVSVSPGGATVTGQFLGSLPWASPEQAAGAVDDLDVRSDVYALGVLMYQMLTARFPYQVVGHAGDVMNTIQRDQALAPRQFNEAIDDEIQTIILKCLSKERERRYQNAGELARDLRRYLAGESIEAKRDSAWYVLSKTLHRHRAAVAVGIGLVLLLAVIAVGSSILWRQARAAADRAEAALAVRDAAVDFLIADMVGAVDPRDGDGRSVTVVEVLDEAGAAVQTRFAQQPVTAASVHAMLGNAYKALGLYAAARTHLEQAVTLHRRDVGDDLVAAQMLEDLGATLLRLGAPADAERHQRDALAIRLDRLGEGTAPVAMSRTHLAAALARQRRHAEAEQLDRAALATLEAVHGPDDPLVARSLNQLAVRLRAQGRPDDAEPLLRRAVTILETVRGSDHPDTAAALNNLAVCLMFLDRPEDAAPILERSLAIKRAAYGDDDPRVAVSLQKVAELWFLQRGDPARAEPFARDALAIRRSRLGEDHPRTATTLHLLGRIALERGDPEDAERHLRAALDARQRRSDSAPYVVAETKGDLGAALVAQGRTDQGRTLLEASVRELTATRGADDPATRRAEARLQRLLGTATDGGRRDD